MRTLKLFIAYRGTRYHGFQRQPNAVTVQGELERCLAKVLNHPLTVYGCSRTDTGVHANQFCLHLHTDRRIPCKNLVRGVNGYLPEDISLLSCEEVQEDFHARFACLGKEYLYRIHNHESKNPFLTDMAYHYRRPLHEERLQQALKDVVGTHDFHSFCAQANEKSDTVRTIYDASLVRSGDMVEIYISGNGFLYNMVRIFVGTLLDINEGKIAPDGLTAILAAKNRLAAGRTAMAHGLYLNRVFYDPKDFARTE